MLDDMRQPVNRTVWEHGNGAKLLTVSGLLQVGEYKIDRELEDDGTVVLRCEPKEDDEQD